MTTEGTKKEEGGMREKEKSSQEQKQFLKRSFSVKVRVEESEGLLGPEDVDVDFRRILKEARDERGRKIFETISSDDLSLLVVKMGQVQKSAKETRFVGICKAWDSLRNR